MMERSSSIPAGWPYPRLRGASSSRGRRPKDGVGQTRTIPSTPARGLPALSLSVCDPSRAASYGVAFVDRSLLEFDAIGEDRGLRLIAFLTAAAEERRSSRQEAAMGPLVSWPSLAVLSRRRRTLISSLPEATRLGATGG